MTNNEAAEAIRNKRRSLRLSLHECERQSGISRRTISRCERGEFFTSGDKVEQLVAFLFKDNTKAQKRVMQLIDAELKLGAAEMRERASRKRQRTEASRRLMCIPVFAPRFESTQPIKKETLKDGTVLLSPDPSKALHTRYEGSDVYLVISERKRGKSLQLFTITPDSQTFFDYEANPKLPKDVQGNEAIKRMWLYCSRTLKLGDVAAFDLAEHVVKNAALFEQHSEKDDTLAIHTSQLQDVKNTLQKARKIKNGTTAQGLLLDDAIAHVEHWLARGSELSTAKKKLLRRIAQIRSIIEQLKQS
jgi:transcriptional regulator with XRE-family HTH domain